MLKFFNKLIQPKSQNEDIKRREFIFNILLLGSIALTTIACLLIFIDKIKFGKSFTGLPIEIALLILIVFLFLYYLSRKGFFIISSYIFVGIYFFANTYFVYKWGIDLPQGLLFYTLIIIMSGILISTRFTFIITIVISSVMIILYYLKIKNIISPELYWKNYKEGIGEIIIYILTLSIITIVSWLSNREIERSLKRARQSEAELKQERDLLEAKVEQRTKELKQAQMEKMMQLYRFAEFGRLSSGMFHDLINPLTAVSLNLELVKKTCNTKIHNTKSYLARAISAAKRMEIFITAIRKQITRQKNNTIFSLTEETIQAIQILSYKARKSNVEINFSPICDIHTYGDSIKFSQLITNLISNALDAYDIVPPSTNKREVVIKITEKDGLINLIVQDWGCGITFKHLSKIFEPFFTTKGFDKGTGIGLSSSKDIVKKDFNGKMKVGSREGYGTIFIIKFPLKQTP